MLSTHFIYGYMVSDIWLRTIQIARKETCCHHISYCFRLAARILLYASSHRQDSTYHSLCYTSRGTLAEWEIAQWVHRMKDQSDDPSHHERTLLPRSYISLQVHHEGSIRRPIAPWANALTTELHLAPGPPWGIDTTTHRTMSEHSYHGATSRSWSTMKDRSDDPSHHERNLLPRSYILLRVHHEGSIRRPIAPWANALTTELHLAPVITEQAPVIVLLL